MKYNKPTGWILGASIAATMFAGNATAEVVLEESFDVSPTVFLSTRGSADTEWKLRVPTRFGSRTTSVLGEGLIDIKTEEQDYGGATLPRSDTYDFFNQELTYTFSGISLNPIGQSKPQNQWAKFGLVARDDSVWYAGSMFLVGFNGNGRFSVQVQQPSLTTSSLDRITVKDFKVPYFNFDISKISRVELSLDDTYYRILFVFGTELDQISFGGEHGLNRELWFVPPSSLSRAYNDLLQAEQSYNIAVASGDTNSINDAQSNLDLMQAAYDAEVLAAESIKGDTSIYIAASSTDAFYLRNSQNITDVGAHLTLDSLKVETSNILDVLRNSAAP